MHCDNAATNANSENARSRMEASSTGNHKYGGKLRLVKYWARLGCWISPGYGPFSFGGSFETYEPFIYLYSNFLSGRGEPRILNQWIRGHDCVYVSPHFHWLEFPREI
jgi:hypothetical protein